MAGLLVTGGAGFIGSNFVRRAVFFGKKPVVLDALTYAGNLHNIKSCPVRFVHGDICNAETVREVLNAYEIDEVVHFAAESHVDRSLLGPIAFARTNVEGTVTLLTECRKYGRIRRFVHVSTDEVYGDLGSDDPPFTEQTPLASRSPYAASKAASDLFVRAWFESFRFPVIITRCSNNYGPYQFPEKLIPLMILRAIADEPLPVYGDGLNVRDWIHVDDHCEAIELVLANGREGEVYNIGARTERTNLEIVRHILGFLGKPESLISFVNDRPGHDRRYAVDSTKIREELGFETGKAIEFALPATIRWYQDNTKWWRAIQTGEYRANAAMRYGDGDY